MSQLWWPACFIILGYLFGSVSSAIITCKLMRLPDPRAEGSRNPGATNVLRIGGKKAAIATLLGDVLKGVIPVLLAKYLGSTIEVQSAVALAAVFGHMYPIFFGFVGGKGVATALGAVVALDPLLGGLIIGTWMLVAFITRYSSLASLIAAILTTAYGYGLLPTNAVGPLAAITLLIIYRHRENIQRLASGTESKIGSKRQP